MPLRPEDAETLARALLARFPRRDPLTLRMPDLERWIAETAGFQGMRPSPIELEAVQRRWYELYGETLRRRALSE